MIFPSKRIRKAIIIRNLCLFATLYGLLFAAPTLAQNLRLTGFYKQQFSLQLPQPNEILDARNTVRFDASRGLSQGELNITTDLNNDLLNPIDSLGIRLREAYFTWYLKNGDLTVGRQIISWGRSDIAFLTDILSPIDLRNFLTVDTFDARFGVDAASYTHYFGRNYLQLVVNPSPQGFILPSPNSRWFPQDLFPEQLPVRYERANVEPEWDDIQVATRFALRSDLTYELEAGVMYWRYPMASYFKTVSTTQAGPVAIPDGLLLRETYLQSLIATLSGLYRASDRLLIYAEGAYYRQRYFDFLPVDITNLNINNIAIDDLINLSQLLNQANNGFLVKKPWIGAMGGLQYTLFDWLLRLQYVGEVILNYEDPILQERYFDYLSLTAQRSFFRERLNVQVLSRFQRLNNDFWINANLTYDATDAFDVTLGGNIFGGEPGDNFSGHLNFDDFENNSMVFLRTAVYF